LSDSENNSFRMDHVLNPFSLDFFQKDRR
jgi:hypothetical protein